MGLFDRFISRGAEKYRHFHDFGYFTATIPFWESENWQKEEGFDILPLDDIKVTKFVNCRLYEGREVLGSRSNGIFKTTSSLEIKQLEPLYFYYIPFKTEKEMDEKRDVIENYFNKIKNEENLISYYEDKNILIVMHLNADGYTDLFFDNIKESIQLK